MGSKWIRCVASCGELWLGLGRAGCGAEGYAPVGSEEPEELDAPEELDEPEELEANCATSPANMRSRNGAAGRAPLGRPTHIGSAAIAAGEAASRLCELCWGSASGCSGLGRLACSASRGLPTPWSCRSAVATAAMAVSMPPARRARALQKATLKLVQCGQEEKHRAFFPPHS